MPSIINELESNNMTATIPSHARSESGGRYSPPDTVKAGHATIHNTNHSNDYRSRQRFESTADGDVRVMVDNPTYNNEPSSSTASTSVIPPKKSAFQKRHTRNLSAHFSEGARISSEGGDGDMDGRPVSATFTYDAPTMATYNAPPRRHHEQQQQAPYNHPPQGHHSSPDQFYMSPTSFHYKSAATSSSGNHPPPLPVGVGGARDYPSMQQQAVDETGGGDGAAGHKHRRGFSGGVSNPAHAHRRINSQGGSAPVERTKTTTTIQPQSQYYDGSNQIREAPRRSHHRVTSAGLDMLSAAAGVSKEDLAAAAGPNRPDSAFASMIPPPSSSSQPIMPRHAAGPVVEQHSPQEGHLTSYHSTYNNDPSSSQDYNNHQEYYQGRPYPPQQQHPQSQYYPHPSFHNHNNHHQQQHALSPRAYSFYPQQSCVQTTTQPNMLAHQQHQHPASPVRYDEPQELKIETDELLFANKNGHIPPPTPPTPRHRYAPSCSSIGTLVFDPKMDPSPAKNLHLGGLDGVVVEEDRKTTGSDTFSTTNTGTNYPSQYRNRNARFGGDRLFQSSSNESSPRDGSEVNKNRTMDDGGLSTVPEKVSSETGSKNNSNASRRLRRKCTAGNCPNRVVQGGLCISHGARRKTCSMTGCDKNVKKAGLCSSHGPARKRCEAGGCDKVSVQGGRCISHGAKKKTCSTGECKKQAVVYGMCKRHHDQAVSNNKISPPTKAVRNPTSNSTTSSSKDDQSSPTLLCQSTSIDDTPEPSPIHSKDTNNLTSNNNNRNDKIKPKSHRRGLSIFQDMSTVDTIIGESRDYSDGEEASTPPVVGNNNDNDLASPSQKNGPHHQRGLSIFTDESLTETIIQSGDMDF